MKLELYVQVLETYIHQLGEDLEDMVAKLEAERASMHQAFDAGIHKAQAKLQMALATRSLADAEAERLRKAYPKLNQLITLELAAKAAVNSDRRLRDAVEELQVSDRRLRQELMAAHQDIEFFRTAAQNLEIDLQRQYIATGNAAHVQAGQPPPIEDDEQDEIRTVNARANLARWTRDIRDRPFNFGRVAGEDNPDPLPDNDLGNLDPRIPF